MLFEGEVFASIPAKIWGANVPPPAGPFPTALRYTKRGARDAPKWASQMTSITMGTK